MCHVDCKIVTEKIINNWKLIGLNGWGTFICQPHFARNIQQKKLFEWFKTVLVAKWKGNQKTSTKCTPAEAEPPHETIHLLSGWWLLSKVPGKKAAEEERQSNNKSRVPDVPTSGPKCELITLWWLLQDSAILGSVSWYFTVTQFSDIHQNM